MMVRIVRTKVAIVFSLFSLSGQIELRVDTLDNRYTHARRKIAVKKRMILMPTR